MHIMLKVKEKGHMIEINLKSNLCLKGNVLKLIVTHFCFDFLN